MFNNKIRRVGLIASAVALAPLMILGSSLLVDSGGAASAGGARAGGLVHFQEADTSLNGTVGTVVLTGAITDYGTDQQGGSPMNKYVLSKGSFIINVKKLSNKVFLPLDPKTCSSAVTATASVPIVAHSGTGAYRDISGTFKITATAASIAPRLQNGKCNLSAPLLAGILFGNGPGTVSYTK